MMDRLVCANGGNADPTSAGGKDPVKATQIEIGGWDCPDHLAARAFQEETRNAARALVQAVKLLRRGKLDQADAGLRSPRPN